MIIRPNVGTRHATSLFLDPLPPRGGGLRGICNLPRKPNIKSVNYCVIWQFFNPHPLRSSPYLSATLQAGGQNRVTAGSAGLFFCLHCRFCYPYSPLFKGSTRYCGGGVQNLSKKFIPNPSATLVPLQRGHLRAGVGSVCYFFCVVDHLLGRACHVHAISQNTLKQTKGANSQKFTPSLYHSMIQ